MDGCRSRDDFHDDFYVDFLDDFFVDFLDDFCANFVDDLCDDDHDERRDIIDVDNWSDRGFDD